MKYEKLLCLSALFFIAFSSSAFARTDHFQLTVKNNTSLHYIPMETGVTAPVQALTQKWGTDTYTSDMCVYLNPSLARIQQLYTGKQIGPFNNGISLNDVCKAFKNYSLSDGPIDVDTWGLYSYLFINEAGQQTIATFPSPDYIGGRMPPIDDIVYKMLAGDITQQANIDPIDQANNIESIAMYDAYTGRWQQAPSMTYLYLGQYGGSKDHPELAYDIYKFTIKHGIFRAATAAHNEVENDLKYPWVQPLHSYDRFPDRGQNFSIIFSPYEVEASADETTWYHLGYVLPQGVPGHGIDPATDLNPGDAIFYFSPQAMTVPEGQPNTGTQFKYLKVRQWTKKSSSDTKKTESDITILSEKPGNPFPEIPSGNTGRVSKASLTVDNNIIAQTEDTYTISNYPAITIQNDENKKYATKNQLTINALSDIKPTDYAYFYSPEQTLGFKLATQVYLISNFYDPNDITPLASDPRTANYGNIDKNNDIVVTNIKGQYAYNPKANLKTLEYNNSPVLTGTYDPYTTYYISAGKNLTGGVQLAITVHCNAIGTNEQKIAINRTINTAFNGSNSAFSSGNLTVDQDRNGFIFNQSINNTYGLSMYAPTNNNNAPISYLFYDVNRDGYKNNATLACQNDDSSCGAVVPYTVIMSKYLALEWFANNADLTSVSPLPPYDKYKTTTYFPNPNFAACEIAVNDGGGSFSTSGLDGDSCFDANIGAERMDDYHYSNWYWYNDTDAAADHTTANTAVKNLSATVTDTAGDVLIINSHN